MLREMQYQSAPRHLQVGGRVLLEVVLPIDREAEEPDVELLRLLHAEDAQDRDRLLELDHYSASSARPRLHAITDTMSRACRPRASSPSNRTSGNCWRVASRLRRF